MKRGNLFLVIVLIILISGIVSASFIIDPDYSIQKNYGPNQSIAGWINISFENEPVNSVVSDSFGNSIKLIDWIKNSSGYKYQCNIKDCKTDYSPSNPQLSKNFYLNNYEKKVYGFKLTGEIDSIFSINFNITSNAGASCSNQLEIDILGDGTADFINNKSSTGFCEKSYGCFDESKISEIYILDSIPYCQKIELRNAPGFKIGAFVKKDAGGNSLKMSLYRGSENIENGNCNLADPKNSEWQEVSCEVNYPVLKRENYSVCIFSEDSRGDYKIKGYTVSGGCGFHGIPSKTGIASYKIFAQAKNFDSIGNLAVDNKIPSGETLSAKAQEYISKIYGTGIDCANGCMIPISFKSNYLSAQNVELKNLEIKYSKTSGIVTEKNFYDLQEIPAKINSDYGKLNLDGGKFYVPGEYGNKTFWLKLNGNEIISEEIIIEKVPIIKYLNPPIAPAGVPIKFELSAYSAEGNITKFEWDFGNEIKKQTTANSATYTYEEIGTHEIKVKVTDNNQKSYEKTFSIEIESPKDYINKTLIEKQKVIEKLQREIETFSEFEQKIIKKIVNIEELNSNLTKLQREYGTQANTDEEYVNLTKKIVAFEITQEIFKSKSIRNSIFISKKGNLDLDLIEGIGKGSYESNRTEDYKKAILSWNQEKLSVKMDFGEISAKFSEELSLAKFFSLTIAEKDKSEKEIFLVIPKLENLEFDGNYNEKEKDEIYYILIDSFPKTITFSTTEDMSFTDLAAFTSPSLNELSIASNQIDTEKDEFNWWILILVIISLIIILFIAYVLMYKWYKNNYENYLFKNKNNLYNIATYIEKSKRDGKNNSEIYRNLKRTGWDSEQADYAMKKYAGKKVGMLELPFVKLFS